MFPIEIVPAMKGFKRRIRELDEHPTAQLLSVRLPIEPLVLASWLAHPEVQAWALSMSPEARHNAIQKAIDGNLAEVRNIT